MYLRIFWKLKDFDSDCDMATGELVTPVLLPMKFQVQCVNQRTADGTLICG